MTRIFRLEWELHEPLLFVSRELGSLYQTEPVIGHYAQVYALGWATSPYQISGAATVTPRYAADLAPLSEAGTYITPARPCAGVRTRFERFNVAGEGYRARMDQGVVVDDLDILLSGKKGRAINRPQQGVWQLIERGTRFESFVLCHDKPTIPAWVRLGKTSAKAAITVSEGQIRGEHQGDFASAAWLCPIDLPDDATALGFDLLAIPPVPILRTPRLRGRYVETTFGDLPADMRFRFP